MNRPTLAAATCLLTGLLDAQASPRYQIKTETIALRFSDALVTDVDIRYPTRVGPSTGWPGVLCLHGTGTSRKAMAKMAAHLAEAGYFTFAYDTRGYGRAKKTPLNDTDQRRLLDAEECIYRMGVLYPKLFDQTKLAATGKSRGGGTSLRLAAYSGRRLPETGWVSTGYRMRAVSTQIATLDGAGNVITQNGDLMRGEYAEGLWQAQAGTLWQIALAGDYHKLRSRLLNDPVTNLLPNLKGSGVAILCQAGYHDNKYAPDKVMDLLAALNVPCKGLVTGPGHGSPSNNEMDQLLMRDESRRWFDRHVENVQNRIDLEPKFESAVMPFTEPEYRLASSHWAHRLTDLWPPTPPLVTKYYLREAGTLTSTPPPTVEQDQVIAHVVAPGYTLTDYAKQGAGQKPNDIFPSIPFVQMEYVASASVQDIEIYGRPAVTLTVTPSQGFLQLSASLWSRGGPARDRYLTGGTHGKRIAGKGQHTIRIEMRDASYIVPAGERLVVKLHNLSREQPPGQDEILWVPPMQSVTMNVAISNTEPAALHLPVRGRRGVNFTPRIGSGSARAGFDHKMLIDAGQASGGNPYCVYMGVSGTAPGVFLGTHVWLNPDPLTTLAMGAMNSNVLPGFLGTLDPSGQAMPHVILPGGISGIAGLRVSLVTLLVLPGGIIPSEPIQLDIFH